MILSQACWFIAHLTKAFPSVHGALGLRILQGLLAAAPHSCPRCCPPPSSSGVYSADKSCSFVSVFFCRKVLWRPSPLRFSPPLQCGGVCTLLLFVALTILLQMPWRVLVGAKLTGSPDGDTSTFPSPLGSGRISSCRLEVVYGRRRHPVLMFASSGVERWALSLSDKPGLQCLHISPPPL